MTIQKSHKVIFWDYDGTLVVNSKWSGGLLKALDARHPGHGITDSLLKSFLNHGFPWHFHERHHPELSSPQAWWGLVTPLMAGACEKAGIDRDESFRLAEMARETILRPDNYILYDDTFPVLEDLKARGWKHYVLSNNFPELPEIVRGMPLNRVIEDTVTSGLAGCDKPNPGIFRYALEMAGNPEKAWMVGDNIFADVRGGEAAGLPAILVRSRTEQKVRYFAENLRAAAEIIERESKE